MRIQKIALSVALFAMAIAAGLGFLKWKRLKLDEPHWQRYRCEAFHFSIESPYPLEPEERDYVWAKDNRGVVRSWKAACDPARPFSLSLACNQYAGQAPSLEGWKARWVNTFAAKQASLRMTRCCGLPALRIAKAQALMLVVVKGRWMWIFDAAFPEGQKQGLEMAERILKSIQIDPKFS